MSDTAFPAVDEKILTLPEEHSGNGLIATKDDETLVHALQESSLPEFEKRSVYAACLMPILQAIGWTGNAREIAEALPHYASNLDLQDMRNVLAQLGYTSLERPTSSGEELDHRLLPCLFETLDGNMYVLHSRDDVSALGFCGRERTYVELPLSDIKGKAFVVQPYELSEAEEQEEKENWLRSVVRRFRSSVWRLLTITFIINIVSLVVPFYIMAVYDQVIPSESTSVLIGLTVGAILAVTIDMALRIYRSKMMAFLGSRLEYTLSSAALARILSLPAGLTENAPLGNQIARLKDFDSFREMFTSVLYAVALELPFVILFLIIIMFLAGPIVFVPIAMIAIYAVLWFIMGPALQRAVKNASHVKAEKHSFLVELVIRLRTIKENRAEKTWKDRYRKMSANTAAAHKDTVLNSFNFQTASQAVITLAALSTVTFGVLAVINNDMTIGALIATMALVWRVLSPIQNLFMTLARATQIKVAVNQINALMRMNSELDNEKNNTQGIERTWRGALSLQRVSFRYNNLAEPALLGMGFTNVPGEMVGITGANGSGKSTLLRTILGLYRPQAGQISLDGMDIRQIPVQELRRAMAYLPQTVRLFHGTIAQNLRLANPLASKAQMLEACKLAGVLDEVLALNEGFDTRVGDQTIHKLSASFVQKIGLARTLIKDAPIILMDEPAQTFDKKSDENFIKTLQTLKGTRTILMVSHRPSHLRVADRLIVLNQGTLAAMGAPETVLSEIPEGML